MSKARERRTGRLYHTPDQKLDNSPVDRTLDQNAAIDRYPVVMIAFLPWQHPRDVNVTDYENRVAEVVKPGHPSQWLKIELRSLITRYSRYRDVAVPGLLLIAFMSLNEQYDHSL